MELFEHDGHTVILGDAIPALASIPDESVDLIFADPPYNIGKNFNGRIDRWETREDYLAWCYSWIDKCLGKLSPSGSIYLMAATQYMPFIEIYVGRRLEIVSRIIWHYDSSGVQAKRYFGSLYEPILFAVKDRSNYTFNAQDIKVPARTGAVRHLIDYRKAVPAAYSSTKVPGNVWYYPRVRYRMPEYEDHPSQKPLSLMGRIIKASSNPGDLVLDPFAGTFTTCVVAKEFGRRTVGIELEEKYVKVGLRRLGLATAYKGKPLAKAHKPYKRRNRKQQMTPLPEEQ